MYQMLVLCFALILVAEIKSQTADGEISNPCTIAVSCGQCIGISNKCAWCGAETIAKGGQRCDLLTNLKRTCEERYISNPKSEMFVDKSEAWTSGDNVKPPVQVVPQQITWKIRPNDPKHFTLKFKQQDNYPVDLYFLLDLSFGVSREGTKPRLIALGKEIPEKMRNITNNFNLGFGTFVDKTLMPYIAWTEQMKKDRCSIPPCADPHDFKNQLNISGQHSKFAPQMNSTLASLSLNFDDAEGGLDGVIQALDCDSIGWRTISRRIIVYCSNSIFHLAGDGKFGGATKQSDLKCALNNKQEYTHEKIYDYPSVSQIASKLKEKKANVIFAVMQDVFPHYQKLSHLMDGAVVGKLEDDSANIVQLISDKYYELRSRIKFEPRNSDFVDIKFYSYCKDHSQLKETSVCENLEISDSVEFNVTLTVSSDICKDKSGEVEQEVVIDAVGLNEQLSIKLKVACECECERPDQEVAKSDKCTAGNGTFECGVCNCDPGRYGRKCECDESQISNAESQKLCRNPEKNETQVCSGHGECICGVCECFPISSDTAQRYSDTYCQCNDYRCPVGPNGLCGGSLRGICKCGVCECINNWSGEDCECTLDTTSCLASNGKICNDAGTCKCGRCTCTKESAMAGPTCEDCPSCPSQCSEYIDCAQCKAHSSGKFNKFECDANCRNVTLVDTLRVGKKIRSCEGIDVDGCTFYFTYEYTLSNDVIIEAQTTKDCPAAANVAAIVGGTVAAVVLIPLLIIFLIIFIRNRRDAKEYAEFTKERERARWESGANPIYKDPKSTFKNPTYGGEN